MRLTQLIVAAASLATPLAAAGSPSYVAGLVEPASVSRVVSSERLWSCEGATCLAGGSATSPAKNICVRLAKELGTVASFSAMGRDFSAEELTACNERAGRASAVAAAK